MNRETNQKHLLKILTEAVRNKIYGSVEIYFEEGRMTQITQRIINKINAKPKEKRVVRQKLITKITKTNMEESGVPLRSLEL